MPNAAPVLVLALSVIATSTRPPNLGALEGTYFAVLADVGACYLQLSRDATVHVTCGNEPPAQLGVTAEGGSILVFLRPRYAFLRKPSRSSGGVSWLSHDPTQPLIAGDPSDTATLLLQPVRWGSRVYLIAAGDRQQFCLAAALGMEPRIVARGPYFLRLGDHSRAVPSGRLPPGCETPGQ